MSVVADPKNRSMMKLQEVSVQVTTESPVHCCDRCGEEAPRAVSAKRVETNREWEAGTISLQALPDGWTAFYLGGVRGEDNRQSGRWLDLCGLCASIVCKLSDAFIASLELE